MTTGKLGFGLGHFSKPTPQMINNIVHASSAIFAILVAGISQDKYIGVIFKEEFSLWGGVLVALLQAARPFFGKEIASAVIPTQDVSAVKE